MSASDILNVLGVRVCGRHMHSYSGRCPYCGLEMLHAAYRAAERPCPDGVLVCRHYRRVQECPVYLGSVRNNVTH